MMMAANDGIGGEQLIFLISQPRSGSTLLQHVLGSHPRIHTLPEPWFMLHFAYALREQGISTEYNARFSSRALKGFLQEIGRGEELYWQTVRGAAGSLYAAALKDTGKEFFLDKTPRYYFIIPELQRIFPKAAFVFLLRNPMAVFASILSVSLRGRWQDFRWVDRRHDLMTAPGLMLEGIQAVKERTAVVHYEELASDPEKTLRSLCAKLALPFDPGMLDYGGKIHLTGAFVDPKSIHQHTRPVTDYVARWAESLNTPEKVQMASVYLELLGRETVERLGYSYGELQRTIDAIPGKRGRFKLPFKNLLLGKKRLSWWARVKLSWMEK
jgi:hypothetical protein